MDSMEHSHIPYVVILVRILDDWKKEVHMEFQILTFSNMDFIH